MGDYIFDKPKLGTFRFHLFGNHQPIELEVAACTIGDVAEIITRQRYIKV